MLSGTVFVLVLAGAALHAAWNVAVRGARDRRREAALVVAGGAALAALALPFLPLPRAAAWPWLLGSVALHVVYFALVAEAYARGAVALAYPLMRGAAPALVALVAWPMFGEALPAAGWLGVAAVCAGVLLLARNRRHAADAEARAAVGVALANAGVIAAYTLVDAAGARASGHAVAYTLWLFVLMAVPTVPVLLRFRIAVPGGAEAVRALGGGGASLGAYALALWAMAQAPVAAVAALRETSTLFGLVLARLALGERPGAAGWAGAAAIAAGAALIRLA